MTARVFSRVGPWGVRGHVAIGPAQVAKSKYIQIRHRYVAQRRKFPSSLNVRGCSAETNDHIRTLSYPPSLNHIPLNVDLFFITGDAAVNEEMESIALPSCFRLDGIDCLLLEVELRCWTRRTHLNESGCTAWKASLDVPWSKNTSPESQKTTCSIILSSAELSNNPDSSIIKKREGPAQREKGRILLAQRLFGIPVMMHGVCMAIKGLASTCTTVYPTSGLRLRPKDRLYRGKTLVKISPSPEARIRVAVVLALKLPAQGGPPLAGPQWRLHGSTSAESIRCMSSWKTGIDRL
ncbi:hypothetical protein IW262DRAFT_1290519 [Armillaria fumosa]|nr:hypothetical protein IW262DRAFT_1290519 [Armillaria fumosa]